jgi:hypothetical protein
VELHAEERERAIGGLVAHVRVRRAAPVATLHGAGAHDADATGGRPGFDDQGGVLVDADAEGGGVLRDGAEEPPDAPALGEVWSTMTPGRKPSPGARRSAAPMRYVSLPEPATIIVALITDAPADVPATTPPSW